MSTDTKQFGRIALVGIGLIASSLARIIRRGDLAEHVAVTARTQASLDTAAKLDLADSFTLDAAEAVDGADIVIIATPMGAYGTVIESNKGALKPGAIVSDEGSVKGSALADLAPHIPDGDHLVPAHPVAGTEHSGPESGFTELFEGRWCVLTPAAGSDQAAIDAIADLWAATGANIEIMDAEHHDLVMAITSHLPHLIAYTIVGTATDLEHTLRNEVIKYSASGFRDFTRIAASDPSMWRDVFLNNQDAVLEMLQRFTEDLTAMQRAIRRGEGDTLFDLFERTRTIRRGVIDAKQA